MLLLYKQSSWEIVQYIYFCVPPKKVCHMRTRLDWSTNFWLFNRLQLTPTYISNQTSKQKDAFLLSHLRVSFFFFSAKKSDSTVVKNAGFYIQHSINSPQCFPCNSVDLQAVSLRLWTNLRMAQPVSTLRHETALDIHQGNPTLRQTQSFEK